MKRIHIYGLLAPLLILLAIIGCGSDSAQVSYGVGPGGIKKSPGLSLQNSSGNDVKVYIVFVGGLTGNGGSYTASDFQSQGCDMYRPDRCSLIVPKGKSKTLNLAKGGINLSGGLDNEPMGPCPTTMFEINISPQDNKTRDSFDLSLVNGFNYSMQITSSTGSATAFVTKATGNHNAVGVFPLGCTQCISLNSNPPSWPNCPGNASSCGGQCYNAGECKSGPDERHPNAACVLEVDTGGSYTVHFGNPS